MDLIDLEKKPYKPKPLFDIENDIIESNSARL
jgi:hypothetical protein